MIDKNYNQRYILNFNYKLPFNKFSRSYELNKYVHEIAVDRQLPENVVIRIYMDIAVHGLKDSVNKMINHDGVCNRKNLKCIIDYPENSEIRIDNIDKSILAEKGLSEKVLRKKEVYW
jgi:hypothetical protein